MADRNLDAILLCPTGQDAALLATLLKNNDIHSVTVKNIPELCDFHHDESGVILIAEEALTSEGIDLLNQWFSHQQPWSDIPIILLRSGGARKRNRLFHFERMEDFISSGNVTILERPLQPITLLSATQVALRARRRQYQVRDLLQAQLEATKIRDEFISIASHELKTPLTSLKLQTQLAKRHLKKSDSIDLEKMEKQLDHTLNQVDRLNKLVDDMLDITRLNTGKLRLEKEKFNLSDLVIDLIERFRPQFEAAGCRLTSEITPNLIGNWDIYKIEQVINNLFSNAVRYSANGDVYINLSFSDNYAILRVKDSGMGIDPSNHERIFERFERAASSASGLGLGLYITRQIVDLHEGKIRVESELGKGSEFIIELPANTSIDHHDLKAYE